MNAIEPHHINNAVALLALSEIRGVGFETLCKLARKGYSFTDLWNSADRESLNSILRLHGARSELAPEQEWRCQKRELLEKAESQFDDMSEKGVSIIFKGAYNYPSRLMDLRDPPEWLFVQGNLSALFDRTLTVVGTRKPTRDGVWLAEYVGHCLWEHSLTSVSGLADGIDQAIHIASLRYDLPTVAVLGTGIYSDYPRGAGRLRMDIVRRRGAIVTEYLPNDSFSAKNFVRRNRIQAALGNTVIPVEWAVKSGTAHTVKFARDLGRQLAFIRVNTQQPFHWIPREFADGAKLYTLPTDQSKFSDLLRETSRWRTAGSPQPNLFED